MYNEGFVIGANIIPGPKAGHPGGKPAKGKIKKKNLSYAVNNCDPSREKGPYAN